MKRFFLIAVLIAAGLSLGAAASRAQNLTNYTIARTTVNVPSPGYYGTPLSWQNYSYVCNNYSAPAPIGFTFYYLGQAFTQFQAISNGMISLGTATSTYPCSQPLLLVPQCAETDVCMRAFDPQGISYVLTGPAGDRVLAITFNMRYPVNPPYSYYDYTWQIHLLERGGAIKFIYNTESNSYVYRCGLTGLPVVGEPTRPSETLFQQTANSTTFGAACTNLANLPAPTSQLTFTPLYGSTPAPPTAMAFVDVSSSGMIVSWVDSSIDETLFTVSRSTDNINFTAVGYVSSSTTAGTGTSYSLPQAGLVPGTTYYFRVTAGSEGVPPSLPLAGSQSTSPPSTVTTAGSGNWSSTVPGAPWPGGVVPGSADIVTTADGHTVYIDCNAGCWSLAVGQGNSGILQFAPGGSLTVGGDVTIANGGTLRSSVGGGSLVNSMVVGGSLTNNGTLDLSSNNDSSRVDLAFTGPGNTSLMGGGPVTDIGQLTVDKGESAQSILDVNPANLTIRGATADTSGFVRLLNGTAKLSGTYPLSSRVLITPITSYVDTIRATTGLWLANPNLTVVGRNRSVLVLGQIHVSDGVLNIGTFAERNLLFKTGSSLAIDGGAINVAGRLGKETDYDSFTYTQTGGVITVATAGNTSSYPSIELLSAGVTIAGGVIAVQRAASSSDYYCQVNATITGGMLQLGTAASGPAQVFKIQGLKLPSLVISSQSAMHTVRLLSESQVVGSVTVQSGAALDLNGYRLTVRNGDLAIDGAVTGTSSSEVVLSGTTTQTVSGTGTVAAPLNRLTVDNPGGVTLAGANNITVLTVALVRGAVTNANRITLGNGGSTAASTLIGGVSTELGGSYNVSPAFNVGTGGYSIQYLEESSARTTGFEVPTSRVVKSLNINNPRGVTLAGGNLTVTGSLSLYQSILTTDPSNTLVLANSVTSPPGSAASFVNGPLGIEFNVTSPTTRTYAIGRGSAFRPLVLKAVNTGGVARTYVATVAAGPCGGVPQPPLQQLSPTRYWTISGTASLNPGARVNLAFGSDDLVPALTSVRVAQAATSSGNYQNLGGVTTGTIFNGTVESTVDLTAGSDYFALGFESLPVTWDGGAGTSNWGDATNWSPDGVPGGSSNVVLTQAAATTIQVGSAFDVGGLTVSDNVRLNLGAGSLAVNGNLALGGGTVDLGTGTLSVTGTSLVSGGTLLASSGTLVAGGTLTLSGGNIQVGAGALRVGSCALSGGNIDLGSGILDVSGSITLSYGYGFVANQGTVVFSGAAAQTIPAMPFFNLTVRNGGAGTPKNFSSSSYQIAGDLVVESTAQMAGATDIQLAGNLSYSGLPGGANISSMRIYLTGSGKTLSGAGALRPSALPPPEKVPTNEHSFVTGAESDGDDHDSRSAPDNKLSERRAEVEAILQRESAEARVVIDLDDATVLRNPGSFIGLLNPSSPLEMSVFVNATASYTLDDGIVVARLLQVDGRLDCDDYSIGGAGYLTLKSTGTLGIGGASGVYGALINTGTNTFEAGAVVEYNASGDQIIEAPSHPAACMIYTAGSGTKTLGASKTLTANSGEALTKGVLVVGAGTTFSDGGYRLSLATPDFANIIVNGSYRSIGSGSISYQLVSHQFGPEGSNILATDGTAFGDLFINFGNSQHSVDLNASGTANLGFRNIVFGGDLGPGTAGGTLRLNETGTTNVTVAGNVSFLPRTSVNSGGGFGGTAGTTGIVVVRGNMTSTSVATTQPLFNNIGTNTLVMGGLTPQAMTLLNSATVLSGATLRIQNPAGVSLGGGGSVVYTIDGTLDLAGGNLITGTRTLAVSAAGSLVRTGGHVVGNLRRVVPAGFNVERTFDIGTGSNYTPVNLAFGHVGTGGTVTASTVAGDHPQIAGSGLEPTRSVNRTWSLTNSGTTFNTCDATFTFVPGDVDPGASPASFFVAKYDAPSWSAPSVGVRTPTSTQVLGLSSFSDFALGEVSSTNYTLTINIAGVGTVTRTPDLPSYSPGTPVQLAANAGPGFLFGAWGGDAGGSANPLTVTMDRNKVITATFNDVQAPVVAVSAPNGGEVWPYGTTQTIRWTATDNGTIAGVDLHYSLDGGLTYPNLIATGVANAGSYGWLVPNTPSTTARVRVTARDAGANSGSDASDADFEIATGSANNVIALVPPACLGSPTACDSVRVTITRADSQALRGYSVTFALSAEIELCAGTASIRRGPYLVTGAGPNGTSFAIIDRGSGVYTVDEAILGLPCGATEASGTLFTIGVRSTVANGNGTVAITALTLRDCANAPVTGTPGSPATVPIDTTPPTPITLTAVQGRTGNGTSGRTAIDVTVPAGVSAGDTVRVYRKGFGNYPEYDDPPVPGSAPAVPATEAAAVANGWALVTETPGPYPITVADTPASRDFWYYVAFVEDGCGNVGGATAITAGTLNYHLGDVAPVLPPPYEPAGDNAVAILDISRLGANYGISLQSPDPLYRADLDVGPTAGGRPTTDNRVDFEDLMIFAINYGTVSMAPPPAGLIDVAGGRPGLDLRTEATADGIVVRLLLTENPGTVKGVHALIAYPRQSLTLVGAEAGELLNAQGQPYFFRQLDEGAAGIHAALLGDRVTIHGSGEIARLRFRGRGGVSLEHADLRDLENRFLGEPPLAALPETEVAPELPTAVELVGASPNPFNPSTLIRFRLPAETDVTLRIYDVSGELKQTLVSGLRPAGEHFALWDGQTNRGGTASSGVYLVRLSAGGRELTHKIQLVK